MSLKFTAMGRLPILSTLGTLPRADEEAQKFRCGRPDRRARRRQLRQVQLELAVGLYIFCIAASLAFLMLSASAP
jgi:putative copper export protein